MNDYLLNQIDRKSGKSKKILAILFILLTVHGLVGFAMFILEESMQTTMFTAFAYQNAKDYSGLERHIKLMEKTQITSEIIIYSVGWLAPLMFPSYITYLEANAGYIKAMKAVVRSHKLRY